MRYKETKDYLLINDKMQNMFDYIEKESVEAIVTDPPYELGFMGKSWDSSGVAFQVDTWQKCYDALKPGGYLLAFGGSRTYHRIACAIEDAGFEIRDTIMWLYGSGFPKSMNIGLAIDKKNGVDNRTGETRTNDNKGGGVKTFDDDNYIWKKEFEVRKAQNEWQGWGTCLKPAYEPIIVARKPFKGSLVDNVIYYGVGGLNIGECRVGDEVIKGGTTPDFRDIGKKQKEISGVDKLSFGQIENAARKPLEDHNGRFPANVILTYDETDKDDVCSGFPYTKSTGGSGEKSIQSASATFQNFSGNKKEQSAGSHLGGLGDEGSAARYFYCAKASKKDRDEGLELFDGLKVNDGRQTPIDNPFQRGESLRKNIHPTVKPVELMQYLVRLVAPKGSTVMDCFMGSGSTGKAVMFENRERESNYKFIGIEMTDEYLPICESRIEYALNKYEYDAEIENKKDHEEGRLNIFDFIEEDKR